MCFSGRTSKWIVNNPWCNKEGRNQNEHFWQMSATIQEAFCYFIDQYELTRSEIKQKAMNGRESQRGLFQINFQRFKRMWLFLLGRMININVILWRNREQEMVLFQRSTLLNLLETKWHPVEPIEFLLQIWLSPFTFLRIFCTIEHFQTKQVSFHSFFCIVHV